MKEYTNPETVPYGFGCSCSSEKVIFCYNKKTGQKTWSCSGKCFEVTENNYSPPLNHSVQILSHSTTTQTDIEPHQPTTTRQTACEIQVSGFDSIMVQVSQNADDNLPSFSTQYVSSGNVVYCVSEADNVDLEPVPILDKPEGVHYDKEKGEEESGVVEDGSEIDGDDDDGDDYDDDGDDDDGGGDSDNDADFDVIFDDDDDTDDGSDDDGDDEDDVNDDGDAESSKEDSETSSRKKQKGKNEKAHWKCENCEKTFTNKKHYEMHVKAHRRPKPLQCKHCLKTFKSEKSQDNHNKKHFEEELLCFICSKIVHSLYELERHILTHPKQKSFKCDTCGTEIKSAHCFAKHLARHKELECKICEKVFKNEKQLTKHEKIHESSTSSEPSSQPEVVCNIVFTPEVTYKECKHCGKVCTASEFRSHVKTHAKKRKSLGPFRCTYCGKLSDTRTSHDRHLRIHTKEKPFKCTYEKCDKTFARKGDLRIHLRRHNGERPFKCDRCEKGFVKKWDLDEHLRTHTGARPFKCDFCEKCFSFKNVLKTHLAQHTGEKPFKCPQCENQYVKKSLLAMHLVTHSGEKPYKCLQCEKAFLYKHGLTEHLRMHKR